MLSASSADAHAKLVASTPAANASIAAPAKLQLSFDEKLVAKGSSVELFATTLSGKKLAAPMSITVRSALGADGKSMVAPIGKPLSAGTYLVAWHAVTSDGERKTARSALPCDRSNAVLPSGRSRGRIGPVAGMRPVVACNDPCRRATVS
ncbi:copper resistance protein CopC [Hankyongella ginsenosidimutans]|uniref:copper resistance protein CopC n=1 Tax=Hankyongella ginsenosidimutans TaxID=1763828 RepID=UPI001CA31C55|nr:copper resistance protein CopC [Hankyongella ginsenosidimutans]